MAATEAIPDFLQKPHFPVAENSLVGRMSVKMNSLCLQTFHYFLERDRMVNVIPRL
jgi:hypothetical protein